MTPSTRSPLTTWRGTRSPVGRTIDTVQPIGSRFGTSFAVVNSYAPSWPYDASVSSSFE